MNYGKILSDLSLAGNLRSIPPDTTASRLLDFSSNDYLGLASRRDLREEFITSGSLGQAPFSASASRLLAASQDCFTQLESILSRLYGRDALLFNSGYHVNSGLIPALADGRTLILADRLVHASIIDGIMLAKCEFARFRHNDLRHLEHLIERSGRKNGENILVIVEGIYSMDGDCAPVAGLVELKSRYPRLLYYVDEAHSFGVAGPQGLGLVMASDHPDVFDVIVGTLGKALASIGAFAAVNTEIKSMAINRARSFIFSTALPPVNVAWSTFMLRHMLTMARERDHLYALGNRLADGLRSLGAPVEEQLQPSPRHICPYVIGDAARAVALSQRLARRGFKVLPIRTPTVPPGTERLRISLSAAMSVDDVDSLTEALKDELSVC